MSNVRLGLLDAVRNAYESAAQTAEAFGSDAIAGKIRKAGAAATVTALDGSDFRFDVTYPVIRPGPPVNVPSDKGTSISSDGKEVYDQ